MSKQTNHNLSKSLEPPQTEIPWWNRPVFGEGGLLEPLLKRFRKIPVAQSTIFLYSREMMDLRVLAKTAEAIDNEKFGDKEFLFLIKLRYFLLQDLGEYAGLYHSIKLLQVAIAVKDSFLKLYQTELRYRSSKQQEFYAFVEKLLDNYEDSVNFRQQVQVKLTQVLPKIKTEAGKIALQSYEKHLETISEHKLGLKLLSLFKTYQLADYSVLRSISEMIDILGRKDLQDLKTVMAVVMVNYSAFERLERIIGVPQQRSNPETYAKMIQYIALTHKHQLSFMKFEELIKVMRRWYIPYQAILGIRQEHPPDKYQQPKEFSQPIPGENIYHKYKKWLTDSKTGIIYIDIDLEGESL